MPRFHFQIQQHLSLFFSPNRTGKAVVNESPAVSDQDGPSDVYEVRDMVQPVEQ